MGKKSQERFSGMSYEQRIETAKAYQEEERKKQAEEVTKAIVGARKAQGIPNVDMKPEEVIEGKILKHPQMTFKQKLDMFRAMRARKRYRKEIPVQPKVIAKGINEEVKVVEEQPEIVIEAINYRCKDCKEAFQGVSGVDTCMFCNSKNIEVVNPTDTT